MGEGPTFLEPSRRVLYATYIRVLFLSSYSRLTLKVCIINTASEKVLLMYQMMCSVALALCFYLVLKQTQAFALRENLVTF